MRHFPKDSRDLNIDGLLITGALSNAIPETDLPKTRLLDPHTNKCEGNLPGLQIMVANGQREAPNAIATVELQFEVGDNTFREKVMVKRNLTSLLIRLLLLQRNSTITDMRQENLNSPCFFCS